MPTKAAMNAEALAVVSKWTRCPVCQVLNNPHRSRCICGHDLAIANVKPLPQ
jgi:hypothetical protein